MAEIEILLPTVQRESAGEQLTPRPESLDGLTVAFLSNNKPNVDYLFEVIEEELRARYPSVKTRRYAKQLASGPAPGELLDKIAAECSAAIVGVGD